MSALSLVLMSIELQWSIFYFVSSLLAFRIESLKSEEGGLEQKNLIMVTFSSS